jgi:beta-galactosidase
LIKGDWQIGNANMVRETKGLWGDVLWNGQLIKSKWAMRAGLVYERERSRLPQPLTDKEVGKPLRWYRTTFARPVGQSFALDMGSMTKGLVWVNGHCLGRYWLTPGAGANAEFISGSPIQDVGVGEPTQRYMHLPADWLNERNELLVFEELGGDVRGIQIVWASLFPHMTD